MDGIESSQRKLEKYDVQLKIIIIGDSSVGKSCILNYYLKNTCKEKGLGKGEVLRGRREKFKGISQEGRVF